MIDYALNEFSYWMFTRGSAIGINRVDGPRYLNRHYLYRNPGRGGVLLHTFYASDPDEPHCHPWDNRTVILRGSYYEDIFTPGLQKYEPPPLVNSFVRKPGYISPWRPAAQIHRIRLINEQPVWTLFFYGARQNRQWGFHSLVDGSFKSGEDVSERRASNGRPTGRFLPIMDKRTETQIRNIEKRWGESHRG